MSELEKNLEHVHPPQRINTPAAIWFGGAAVRPPQPVSVLELLASAEPADPAAPGHVIVRGAHD